MIIWSVFPKKFNYTQVSLYTLIFFKCLKSILFNFLWNNLYKRCIVYNFFYSWSPKWESADVRTLLSFARWLIQDPNTNIILIYFLCPIFYLSFYLSFISSLCLSIKFIDTNHSRSRNARKLQFSPKCRSRLPP